MIKDTEKQEPAKIQQVEINIMKQQETQHVAARLPRAAEVRT